MTSQHEWINGFLSKSVGTIWKISIYILRVSIYLCGNIKYPKENIKAGPETSQHKWINGFLSKLVGPIWKISIYISHVSIYLYGNIKYPKENIKTGPEFLGS